MGSLKGLGSPDWRPTYALYSGSYDASVVALNTTHDRLFPAPQVPTPHKQCHMMYQVQLVSPGKCVAHELPVRQVEKLCLQLAFPSSRSTD